MARRSIEGVIEYITDDVGVEGIETYEIHCFDSGHRMLRAHSEMYNDKLIRNTLLTVNDRWQPQVAQMYLMLDDKHVGSGQYFFSPALVRFEGHNVTSGYESARTELGKPVPAFVGHAVQNDAWTYAAFDRHREQAAESPLPGVVVTSKLINGADGPRLVFSDQRHRFLGEESITTRAGHFDVRHYELLFEKWPSIHYWVTGDDYLVIRCRCDMLKQTYELVSLKTH